MDAAQNGRGTSSSPSGSEELLSANEQIHTLFTDSLDALGIHWTRANFKDTAVARQRDVRRLDEFIGPKA
jgi:hypothetical protein